jgi:hypothetical protein
MGTLEGCNAAAADHTTVFVVGFGQQDDVLRSAAL